MKRNYADRDIGREGLKSRKPKRIFGPKYADLVKTCSVHVTTFT